MHMHHDAPYAHQQRQRRTRRQRQPGDDVRLDRRALASLMGGIRLRLRLTRLHRVLPNEVSFAAGKRMT
jgi:hypothetical protein